MELGKWIRLARRALREAGIQYPIYTCEGPPRVEMVNVGVLYRLVKTHGIVIREEES